ncbi:MAG: helix-turn-helix transcriptional regulator [Acholeplasmataceae bacterium]|jgi:transcriptional regulator with XRE-family HTH domain|nr:helix-turn-helix transcriptional regulator [Acholeplasmataceae bacterium]
MYKKNTYLLDKIRQKVRKDLQTQSKLGPTIKQRRKEKDLTLSQLSEKYEVSISYISKVENDLIKPNIDYINPMLAGLGINEEIFKLSEEMDKWYKLAIEYHIDKKNNRKVLYDFANERKDFQAKLILFSLLVKENNFKKATKLLDALIYSIDQMTPIELGLFVFSLVEYEINGGNIISASQIFAEMNSTYLVCSGLKLWAFKIAFEISKYHSSLQQYESIYHEYNKKLLKHNMLDVIIRNREIFNGQQIFSSPLLLEECLDEEMKKNYRVSLILHEEYETFLKLKEEYDLAQVLYEEIVLKKKPKYEKIIFEPNLFEETLLEYFKMKYEKGKESYFLREIVFSKNEVSQHHYVSLFFAKRLIKLLSSKNRYKECCLILERLKEIERNKNKTMNFLKNLSFSL